ncbi:MAG: hypothetical protein L0216_01255 [Planctomycetales bacterium]|nr:hypothetical protein [Planctomycetales bacterium]
MPRLVAGALGLTLVAAGVLKAGRPLDLGRVIEAYRILPALAAPAVAAVLPWIEVACGALLVGGKLRLGAAAVAAALGLAFLSSGLAALARGLHPLCGCFGKYSVEIGAATIAIEAALLAAAAVTLVGEWRRAGAPPPPSSH